MRLDPNLRRNPCLTALSQNPVLTLFMRLQPLGAEFNMPRPGPRLTSPGSVRTFLRLACGGPIVPRWRNW
jgi:hypothetical protein